MMRKILGAVMVPLFVGSPAFAQHDPATHQQAAGQMQAGQEAALSMPQQEAKVAESQQGPHGGSLISREGVQLETLVEPGGVRLFAYNDQGQPLDVRNVRGVATLSLDGVAKRYRYDLYPEVREDQSAEALGVRVDLSQIAGHKGKLNFQLMGLFEGQRATSFSSEFVGPMTEQQKVAVAIANQKVCPVSGQPLGSMGDPISVTVGDDTVYVCCAGCVDKVKADFPKYLAMISGSTGEVPAGTEEVRPGVYKTVAADQPFIEAQKNCPVMDEPLGGMGAPLKVHANGKAIYICCAGCAKKVQAEPDKYLQILAEQGVTAPSLQSTDVGTVSASGEEVRPGVYKVTADEAAFVAAQKLCPVMDEPLDGMGGPYRVNIEGQAVYVCCPGCAKKLQASPQAYLQKLASQGVEPPALK